MTSPTPSRRLIVVKASRDTLVLVAAATAMTFALAYAVSKKAPPTPAVIAPVTVQQQGWTGDLASVAAERKVPAHDPELTSASLVIPKAALALPADPSPRATTTVKKPCDGPTCTIAKTSVPIPPVRTQVLASGMPVTPVAPGPVIAPLVAAPGIAAPAAAAPTVAVVAVKSETKEAPGLASKLNPLNHIPDVVREPFGYAGDKLTGWIKRL